MTALPVLLASAVLLIAWGGGLFPSAVCVVAAACCAAAAVAQVRRTAPAAVSSPPWVELAALVVLLFVALTAIPLPPLLDPLIGPLRREQNGAVIKAFREAAALGLGSPESPWFSLTRNRTGTLRMLLLLSASYGAAALAAALPAAQKIAYLRFLAVAGALVAVGGYLGQWRIPQGDTLWWTIPVPHAHPGPVGCFVNRNHFGSFVAMLAFPALALAFEALQRRRWIEALCCLLLAGVMLAALACSLSRGAALSFALTAAILAGVALVRRNLKIALLAGVAISALAAIVLLIPHPLLRERLATLRHPLSTPSAVNRLSEWKETARIVPHYPVIGVGANALRMVFPQHRTTTSGRWLVHAENQYVQLLAEGGTVGGLLALLCAAALSAAAWRARAATPQAVTAAALGAATLAAVHALFDFAVLVPVYAVVLASLVGLALPAPAGGRRWRALRLAPAVTGLVAAALLGSRDADSLRRLDSHTSLQTAGPADLRKALVRAPTSWHAWYYLGREALAEGTRRSDPALCRLGESWITRAAWCDPNNYRLWTQVYQVRLSLGDKDGARAAGQRAKALRSWLPIPAIEEGSVP